MSGRDRKSRATSEQAGVRRIHQIVGDSFSGFTEAPRRRGTIEWVHVWHEEVAAFDASGEAEMTGNLAICAGSRGPGNLHLINGREGEHFEDCQNRIDTIADSLYGGWAVRCGSVGWGDLQTVDSLIVSVTTDTGVVGWGETFGFTAIPAVKAVIDSILAPECVGRDATQLGKLTLDLQKKFHVFERSGAFIYGLSAIDIALWDIAGKVAKQPVHQLLGGSDATSLPCYASLIRYSDPELVRKNAVRALSSGFHRLKLHEIDVDCVRAAREAVGDDIEIMLDVNCPWSVHEALDTTSKLRPFKLRWLEEPVWPPENYSGLARIRREGG
ncbi:MAG: hypothetical protein JOZ17_22455, partial [Acetobacteraceae bacterium]|nr:hypothetical protein [Acetobacteraceae bacterium]